MTAARVAARLVVGADGRRSLCRAAAGIETDGCGYPQTALTLNLGHARPHDDISTEFHTESGPFTLVPLPGLRSSLVWVVEPAEAERLGALDDARAGGRDRAALAFDPRQDRGRGRAAGCFRSRVETARSFAAQPRSRWSARPRMSSRRSARRASTSACATPRPSASSWSRRAATAPTSARAELLARYDRMRRADVTSRTFAVDLLNRSLLSDFLPVQGARGLGLYLHRPDRAAAPRGDARGRRAGRAAAADARRGAVARARRRRRASAPA